MTVFFDTDWVTDPSGRKQLVSLIMELKGTTLTEISVAVWDTKYGKGIGYIVLSGYIKQVSRISDDDFLALEAKD